MRIIGNRHLVVCFLLMLDANANILYKYLYCLGRNSIELKQYDPHRERCDDGIVVSKATTELPPPPPSPPPPTTSTKAAPAAAAATAFNNRCDLSPEKIKDGYRCCAYGAYNPEYQTCCVESLWKYRVYDDKPAKSHVCCRLDAHKRNEAPCRRNPGNNDKFWETVNLGDAGPTICQVFKYAFGIKVEKQENPLGKYIATLEQIYPYSRKSPIPARQMPIPTDEYSPRADIAGQTFVILSNTNHLASRFLDVFLDSNDQLFIVSKRQEKRRQKIVRKAFKRCERRRRKRHPGKKRGRKRLLSSRGKRSRRS